jgi:hypothetical protein
VASRLVTIIALGADICISKKTLLPLPLSVLALILLLLFAGPAKIIRYEKTGSGTGHYRLTETGLLLYCNKQIKRKLNCH